MTVPAVVQRAEGDRVRSKSRVWVMRDIRGYWGVWLFAPHKSRCVMSSPDWDYAINFAQKFARSIS